MTSAPRSKTRIRLATLGLCLLMAGPAAWAVPRGDSDSPWGSDWFPNVRLTTHEGEEVRFFDDLIEGKVVVINFIYTSCPDSCPLETVRLKEVKEILGERVGQDVFFYSITIDPGVDTPEVLAEYAERYRTGPGWTFLTGDEADIIQLRKKLGLYIAEIQDGSNDHNLSLMIGNQATGMWRSASPFENPHILAQQVGDWLHNWKLPPQEVREFADAPELRQVGKGESLFRTRCAACHTVGGGDIVQSTSGPGVELPLGLPASQLKVGPDLLGVTSRREHEWLMSWLRDPETMLAAEDPIIMGLFEAYNRVPMPNMQLNYREAELLLEYLDEESLRVVAEHPELAERYASGPAVPEVPAPCCEKRSMLAVDDSGDGNDAAAVNQASAGDSLWGRLWRVLAGLPMASRISIALGCVLACGTLAVRRRGRAALS